MVRFIIGDLLTGRRIQSVQASSGSWSEVLNAAGSVSCTVPLRDPANKRLGLRDSAAVGKAFLAAVDGERVLQAGPIWTHEYSEDENLSLTLTAGGMWSYFDHRILLPVLAGRLPTDTTTDTRYWPVVSDSSADGYPWAVDTRTSLQAIAVALVTQAQTWTNGNVPVILPTPIAGTDTRWYRGTDLAFVGDRLKEISGTSGGPDIMFSPRWTTDKLGVEWVMQVGTPTTPMLYSAQAQKFYVGISKSSVSNFQVTVDGAKLATTAFASGGRSLDQAIITTSSGTALTAAGYPALEAVDASHGTASESATLQAYSDELILRGQKPVMTFSMDHDLSQRPYLESFNAGDFATVKVVNNAYLTTGSYSMRIMSRSGDIEGKKVSLKFAPVI